MMAILKFKVANVSNISYIFWWVVHMSVYCVFRISNTLNIQKQAKAIRDFIGGF